MLRNCLPTVPVAETNAANVLFLHWAMFIVPNAHIYVIMNQSLCSPSKTATSGCVLFDRYSGWHVLHPAALPPLWAVCAATGLVCLWQAICNPAAASALPAAVWIAILIMFGGMPYQTARFAVF